MRLKTEGLTKVFGNLTAVRFLSFEIAEGEICGFIGPNGAGKTTTLRMLATVEEPTMGDAWVDGYSITKDTDRVRPLIGFVPDFFGSYPDMLVSEYLDFFARAYGLRGKMRRDKVRGVVEFTEVGPLLGKKVPELSKGMQQRISLCRALVHDPQLLLLDEPAAGLDPQARSDLRELLRVLAEEKRSILISSHILSDLEELADRIVMINHGKLVYCGSPADYQPGNLREFTLCLKVSGDLKACARALLETACVREVHSREPDELRVRMAGGNRDIETLVEKLVSMKQVPYQVVTEGKVLEKIFLEATQVKKEDARPA